MLKFQVFSGAPMFGYVPVPKLGTIGTFKRPVAKD